MILILATALIALSLDVWVSDMDGDELVMRWAVEEWHKEHAGHLQRVKDGSDSPDQVWWWQLIGHRRKTYAWEYTIFLRGQNPNLRAPDEKSYLVNVIGMQNDPLVELAVFAKPRSLGAQIRAMFISPPYMGTTVGVDIPD